LIASWAYHVIVGLDPAIHHEVMDARVKPAHDAYIMEPRKVPLSKLIKNHSGRFAWIATARTPGCAISRRDGCDRTRTDGCGPMRIVGFAPTPRVSSRRVHPLLDLRQIRAGGL